MTVATGRAALRPPAALLRLGLFPVLLAAEIAIVSYLFYFPTTLGEWANPVSYVKKVVQLGILSLTVLALVAWPRRSEILGCWVASDGAGERRHWRLLMPVLGNLAIFAIVMLATSAFSDLVAASPEPPWRWFWAFCGLLAVNALSLALVLAPARFWAGLPRRYPAELALALGGGLIVLLAGEASKESWSTLSAATLRLAAYVLTLYESDVVIDHAQRLLGIGSFRVIVAPECSGYEGIGLVVACLSAYLWVFRSSLRFPHALMLLPIGVIAIWLFNALRIAALISIGAHLSPAVAAGGFHSQAGWIGFLLVAAGLMATAQRIAFFSGARSASRPASAGTASADRRLNAMLIPFMAMLAASVVAAAFAPHGQWLYGLKVAAMAIALWTFRDVYAAMSRQISPVSLIAGLIVGIAWVAMDPLAGQETTTSLWLAALPGGLAALWLALHLAGSVILVPIAEELAFRGYLYGALAPRTSDGRVCAGGSSGLQIGGSRIAWPALLISSTLFGLMHQRWLAGALAGAAYAFLMLRTGRLSDAIAAHMASNAVILAWAIALGQWSLL